MAPTPAVLHMLCGKAAAGKSTLAAQLGQNPNTVVIAEDDWLAALFARELDRLSDYTRCMGKLRAIIYDTHRSRQSTASLTPNSPPSRDHVAD